MVKKYVKAICGFREDQEFSVPLDEAHKLYRIWSHPEERAIFSNGLALIGGDIRRIVPDYHKTMGWNTSHKLDSDDWNELKQKNIDTQLQQGMNNAQKVARMNKPELLNKLLSEIEETLKLNEPVFGEETKLLSQKFKI